MITKEFLETEYSKNKKRVKDIANETGYDYFYLQSLIKKFGIKRRRQYKDLTGQKFGLLKVLGFSHTDDRQQSWWICQCKCGKQKTVKGQSLKDKNTKSCGCMYIKRIGLLSRSHVSNIKTHAKLRNIDFALSDEYMWDLYLKQDKRCAISGVEIVFDLKEKRNTTASLDRIDNTKGYIEGNVQWLHKDINQMKSSRNQKDFLNWIKIISEYQF